MREEFCFLFIFEQKKNRLGILLPLYEFRAHVPTPGSGVVLHIFVFSPFQLSQPINSPSCVERGALEQEKHYTVQGREYFKTQSGVGHILNCD